MTRPLRIEFAGAVYQVTSRGNARLVTDGVLAGFGGGKQAAQGVYRRFVSEGRGQPPPWEQLKNQIYLGSDHFVERMQRQLNPDQSLNVAHTSKRSTPLAMKY